MIFSGLNAPDYLPKKKNAFGELKNALFQALNPRLTKLTKGGVTTPSLDFPNRTPHEIDFGINR